MEEDKASRSRKPRGIARSTLMGQRLWQQAERDLENARLMLRGDGVGANVASAATGQNPVEEEILVKFARLMRKRYGARLYLFGSHARGTAHRESDYDLVAVARAFGQQHILHRAPDRRELWREAGGWGIGLDLHCYTPEEFSAELRGLGYLGQAKRRGELIAIRLRRTV